MPATAPATTQPVTRPAGPVDPQLDAAVSTLIGHIVLRGKGQTVKLAPPATAPATQPAT
jgi:hypothetical protein